MTFPSSLPFHNFALAILAASIFYPKTALSLESSQVQYFFWFQDRIHESWVLEKREDCHMIQCVRRCQDHPDCSGLALGPVQESRGNFSRTCYLLANVAKEDCEQDYDCTEAGTQVYLKDEPPRPTTTELPTSTTTETTITTEPTTSTTTEPTTSTTTEPTTSTTTQSLTSTTTEIATSTTEKPLTTTDAPTTTAKASTTTVADTTTTGKTTTTTQEATTASLDKCAATPVNITCKPRSKQMFPVGLKSTMALFSDINLEVECKNLFMANALKMDETNMKPFAPFSGEISCASEDEVFTGIEMCFQGDVKYLAPYCTPLEDGYKVNRDNIKQAKNSPTDPNKAMCPDKMVPLGMKLEKDDDGNVITYLECAGIEKEGGRGGM